mgnify:FL=1
MAIYHCSIKIGSRAKGQSAVAASAYRSGKKLTDKETGLISDYTRKSGIVFSEISLCKNAPSEYSNRETLWNVVHSIEKNKNAQLWREFEVALPKELNRGKQIETVRDFVSKLTEQGMCIDWALHDKGDGNPHAHIMATMRSIEPNGKWSPKSRKVYDLDEKGERIFQKVDKTGRKQYKNHKEDYNNWNAKERVEEWRSAWAECCNVRLAERERIDHRSFDRQGINQIPTVHEGFIARKLVKDGKSSERVQLNNDIQQKNKKLLQVAAALKSVDEEISRLSTLNEASKIHNEVITAENMPVSEPKGRSKYYLEIDSKQLDSLKNSGIAFETKVKSFDVNSNCELLLVAVDLADKEKALELIAPLKPKLIKRKMSEEEMQRLSDLKHQYVFQYCANEYLKNTADIQYTAKNEYESSKAVADKFKGIAKEYYDIETKIEKTINPIKKMTLKRELAEQGEKACAYVGKVRHYFDVPLYYNSRELSLDNITSEHLYAICGYTDNPMSQKRKAMEAEQKHNEIRKKLNEQNISNESVNATYKDFVALVESVPDEQAERVLNVVKEPTGYFPFETYGYNSKHRLKALENVERALSKLYEAVKRVKAVLDKPLFSKDKVMSDEFKPRSNQENNNYYSYGQGR